MYNISLILVLFLSVYSGCSKNRTKNQASTTFLQAKENLYLPYSIPNEYDEEEYAPQSCLPKNRHLFKLIKDVDINERVEIKISKNDYSLLNSFCNKKLKAVKILDTEDLEHHEEIQQITPWECLSGECTAYYQPGRSVHNSTSIKLLLELDFVTEKRNMVIPIYFKDSAYFFPKNLQGKRNQKIFFEIAEQQDFIMAGPSYLSWNKPFIITKIQGGKILSQPQCDFPNAHCKWVFIPDYNNTGKSVAIINYKLNNPFITKEGTIHIDVDDGDTLPKTYHSNFFLKPHENQITLLIGRDYVDLENDPAQNVIIRNIQGGSLENWTCSQSGNCQTIANFYPASDKIILNYQVSNAKGQKSNFSTIVIERTGIYYLEHIKHILRGRKTAMQITEGIHFRFANEGPLTEDSLTIVESHGIKDISLESCRYFPRYSCKLLITPDSTLIGTKKAFIKYLVKTQNIQHHYYENRQLYGKIYFTIEDINTPPDGRSSYKLMNYNAPSEIKLRLGEEYTDLENDPAASIITSNVQGGNFGQWKCQIDGTCQSLFTPNEKTMKASFEFKVKPKQGIMENFGARIFLSAKVIQYQSEHKDIVDNQRVGINLHYGKSFKFPPDLQSLKKYSLEILESSNVEVESLYGPKYPKNCSREIKKIDAEEISCHFVVIPKKGPIEGNKAFIKYRLHLFDNDNNKIPDTNEGTMTFSIKGKQLGQGNNKMKDAFYMSQPKETSPI